MKLESGAARKLEDALRCWPHAGSGVHSHLMAVANLAAIAGIPAAEAEARIIQTMPRPPSPSSEVASAIRKAYAEHKPGEQYQPRQIAGPKPKALPMTREQFIRKGDGATEADWWEASPIRIDWEPGPKDALVLLDALFAPDDAIFCGGKYDTGLRFVRPVREWREIIERGNDCPPHIVPNLFCGRVVANPKEPGKFSARCDEAVSGFRLATAEFDKEMTKPEQLAFWWGFTTAPIAALIDSGGKSIHAWLKVGCSSRDEWTAEIRNKLFARILIPLGMDNTCANESRLSRLPGHFRREKNAWQRLLYLNPEGTPRNESR